MAFTDPQTSSSTIHVQMVLNNQTNSKVSPITIKASNRPTLRVAVNPQPRNKNENPRPTPTVKDEGVVVFASTSTDSSEPLCRICFVGKEAGNLIHPCKCSGSIAFAHENCLLRWLNEKGSNKCEICRVSFRRGRRYRLIRHWTSLWSICEPNVFQGFLLAVITWFCLSYFILAAIPPESLFMGQAFLYVMCTMTVFLLSTTLLIFMLKPICQSVPVNVVHQWYEVTNQTTFLERR